MSRVTLPHSLGKRLANATGDAAGEQDVLAAQAPQHRTGGTGLAEGVEQQAHRILDLPIGVEADAPIRAVHQPYG